MEWEYRGMTISVAAPGEPYDGLFRVGEGEASDRRYHDSLVEAKADVDDRVAVEAKARHTNLAMPVIDEDGQTHTIRGLNRGSGSMLGVPDRSEAYYPNPVIEALLAERKQAMARLQRIEAILRPMRLRGAQSGRITAEQYDDAISGLEARYAAAMLAAEDIVDPPVGTGHAQA